MTPLDLRNETSESPRQVTLEGLCAGCAGACCESLRVPMPPEPGLAQFLALHGRVHDGIVELETPCAWLTAEGLCLDYEHRPPMCRTFSAGCEACLRTRRERGRADPSDPQPSTLNPAP